MAMLDASATSPAVAVEDAIPYSLSDSAEKNVTPQAKPKKKLTKKQRQKKGEYMRKQEEDNEQLKHEIRELEQKILTLGAENEVLEKEVKWFLEGCESVG